jgi:hypothetical protein
MGNNTALVRKLKLQETLLDYDFSQSFYKTTISPMIYYCLRGALGT